MIFRFVLICVWPLDLTYRSTDEWEKSRVRELSWPSNNYLMGDTSPKIAIKWVDICPHSFGHVWLVSYDWKYCYLIWCERKILFIDWKSTIYRLDKHKRTWRLWVRRIPTVNGFINQRVDPLACLLLVQLSYYEMRWDYMSCRCLFRLQ